MEREQKYEKKVAPVVLDFVEAHERKEQARGRVYANWTDFLQSFGDKCNMDDKYWKNRGLDEKSD